MIHHAATNVWTIFKFTGLGYMMATSLTRSLVKLLAKPVDQKTCQRATLHLLDWIGCSVIGTQQPAGHILVDRSSGLTKGNLSSIGACALASPEDAVFLNGGLGSILEMDDVHRTAILHPGPVVIPAALASAQLNNASGLGFLKAITKGYEAAIRVGESVGKGHYEKWHNTSTCGPFGAAIATGEILDLTDDQFVWALGNAGTQSSGLWRCRHENVMAKQLHTARAAQSGYLAASLSASGFTGSEFILEGEQGFYDAMCPNAQPGRLLENWDGLWKIWDTSFKPWPACRHAHPAIDATLGFNTAICPEHIEAIKVDTYEDAKKFCDCKQPATSQQAKFSIQHAVAICFVKGPPKLEYFETEDLEDPVIAQLRNIISINVGKEFENAYPAHFGASVTVYFKNGRSQNAIIRDALGDPENPVTSDQIIEKARTLMVAVDLSDQIIDQVVTETLSLPHAASLENFTAALNTLCSHLKRGTG